MAINLIRILFIISYILCLFSNKATIFFFILFLPLNPILPKEYNILGLFSYPMVYAFIVFYHHIINNNFKIFDKKSKDPAFTIIPYLFIVYLIIKLYGNIYDYYQGGLFVSRNDNIIIIILRTTIPIIAYLLIIKDIKNNIKISEVAIILSTLLILLSIIFYNQLYKIGIRLEESESIEYVTTIESRSYGIFDYGDVNSLGTLYNFIIAFILALSSIYKKPLSLIQLIIISISIVGIALTGSRMAIIILLLTILLYLLNISIINYRNILIITFIIIIFVYFNLFSYVLERIKLFGISREISPWGGARFERWILYLNEIFSSPRNLLFGYTNIVYFYGEFRDPHNFIIRSLYMNGIVLTLLWLLMFIKSYKFFNKNLGFKNNIIIFIPIIINMLIISQIDVLFIFYILILILYYSNKNYAYI